MDGSKYRFLSEIERQIGPRCCQLRAAPARPSCEVLLSAGADRVACHVGPVGLLSKASPLKL